LGWVLKGCGSIGSGLIGGAISEGLPGTCLVTLRHVTLHQFLCFRRKCNCYVSSPSKPSETPSEPQIFPLYPYSDPNHNPLQPIFSLAFIHIRILLSFQYWRWRIFTCCCSCDHNKAEQPQNTKKWG